MAASRRAWAALLGVAALACATPAAAASLGGIDPSVLQASNGTAQIFAVADSFAGSGPLASHVSDTGQAWTVTTGSYTVGSNRIGAGSWFGPHQAHVTGPGGDYTASITFSRAWFLGQGGGLWLNGNAAGTTGVAVVWTSGAGGTLTVTRYLSGTPAVLDSRTGVGVPGSGDPTPLAAAFDASSGQYTIYFSTSPGYTVTLSPADLAVLGPNTAVGVRSENPLLTTMTDFRVLAS